MRARRALQRSLFDAGYPDHDMGRVLALMSRLLDEHPEFLEWIAADVDRGVVSSVGRRGLPCEVILRCGILKHLWQSDYRELEFALVDSVSARRFTRVDPLRPPKRSALERCIGAVRAEVWERINGVLLGRARDDKLEAGRKVRIDSTVTETHILDPSDSQLLYDAVRVLSRLLARAREKLGPDAFPFHDHRRAAKRKKWKIPKARMKRKVKLYPSCWRSCGGRFGTPMVPCRRSRDVTSRGWMTGARRSHTTGTWPGRSSARRYAGC